MHEDALVEPDALLSEAEHEGGDGLVAEPEAEHTAARCMHYGERECGSAETAAERRARFLSNGSGPRLACSQALSSLLSGRRSSPRRRLRRRV